MQETILIVEDEHHIRKGIAIDLRSEQYQSYEASDHLDAMVLLEQIPLPHVIMTDIMMPSSQIAGINLISDLKQHPKWKNIPIIVISARSEATDILMALQKGAIDYLIKPYEPTDLIFRVRRACEIASAFQPQVEAKPILHQLLVETMRQSLLCWELSKGKSKIDLAESSRMWSTYLDSKGTFSTKTLDKYLQLSTLPKKPRVNPVILTAEYVINACPELSGIKQQLENTLDQLKQHAAK